MRAKGRLHDDCKCKSNKTGAKRYLELLQQQNQIELEEGEQPRSPAMQRDEGDQRNS